MDLTVAICTYNRPAALAAAIDSCLAQLFLPKCLIVIDDGATDADALDRFRQRCQMKNVHFLYRAKPADQRGLTRSRNWALAETSTEFIFYMDDDALLPPDALDQLSRTFAVDPAHQIAGVDLPIVEHARKNAGRRVIDALYGQIGLWAPTTRRWRQRVLPKSLTAIPHLKPVPFLQGGAMAFRSADLRRIGGFDENLTGSAMGEDKDISFRMARLGLLVRNIACPVAHLSDPSARPDPEKSAAESLSNYLYINRKVIAPTLADVLLWLYTTAGLLAIAVLFACVGNTRFHLRQIKGMLRALLALPKRWQQASRFYDQHAIQTTDNH
jgi:GT2 family glycosyltransferase